MHKDIVAVPFGGNAHAMEMQLARILGEVVLESDSHDVANACSEQRRQVSVVVKKTGERNRAKANGAGSGGKHHVESAVSAANLWRLNQNSSRCRSGPPG